LETDECDVFAFGVVNAKGPCEREKVGRKEGRKEEKGLTFG
jgi:hypothetical protein